MHRTNGEAAGMRSWAPTDEPLGDQYLHVRTPHPDRPWVVGNMVAGLDGSTAIDGRVGALSAPADQDLFRRLRQIADVVLVGAETVRAERYGPVRLTEAEIALRIARGQQPTPRVAIVSHSLAFDWSIPLFRSVEAGEPRPLVVTSGSADEAALAEASRHADVLVAGGAAVDFTAALRQLHDEGVRTVLTEGGPRTLGGLAAARLLDELCLTIAPVMGGDPLPVAVWPPGSDAQAFRLDSVGTEGDHLFLRYLQETP